MLSFGSISAQTIADVPPYGAVAVVDGVTATAQLGTVAVLVLLWGDIDSAQSANWHNVSLGAAVDWQHVAVTQAPAWQTIVQEP